VKFMTGFENTAWIKSREKLIADFAVALTQVRNFLCTSVRNFLT
jgi:hypothetical protein